MVGVKDLFRSLGDTGDRYNIISCRLSEKIEFQDWFGEVEDSRINHLLLGDENSVLSYICVSNDIMAHA